MSDIKFIETIPTEALIEELLKRCSPAVFIGTRNEGKHEGLVNFWEAKGNPATCYGLCHELAFSIQKNMIQEEIKELFDKG